MPDMGGALPPVPTPWPAEGAAQGSPNMAAMMQGGASPGMSQMGGAAIRLSMEIDQALKLLAQTVPQLAPWVEQTVLGLRMQLATVLQGGMSASPEPVQREQMSFPDGGGRL